MTNKKAHVAKKKIESVKELSDLVKNKKTILIVSIKNIPSSQFQKIKKDLRGKATIKVPKKNLILKAIDSSNSEVLNKIKSNIKEDTAVLFSDIDAFELAAELVEKKSYMKAKAGQIAPSDITIEAGPTELLPGPAITELSVLGIKTQIEKGKITIKESKVIVKKDEVISDNAANIMGKLDIKPFLVGFIPVAAFDVKEKKLYLNINISKEEALGELKNYFSEDTIKFLISKAVRNRIALEKFAVVESLENGEDSQKQEDNQTPKVNQGENN